MAHQKYLCNTCFKQFADLVDYNIHIATHKKGVLVDKHPSTGKSIKDITLPPEVENDPENMASVTESDRLKDAVIDNTDQDLGVDILNTLKESKDSKEEMDTDITVTTDSKGNFIYTCNICKVYKGNEEQTRLHLVTDHSEYSHSCTHPYCVQSFKTLSGLNKHSKTHKIVTPTKCHNCSKSFKNESKRKQHNCVKTEGASN